MKIILSPSKLNGSIVAPTSKSYMHRILICAAMADKPMRIKCNTFSEDIEATISCLTALGAKIERAGDTVTVTPVGKEGRGECILDCRESGSTLRFMLPVAAALGRECIFLGAERLGRRPLKPLLEALCSNGAEIDCVGDDFLPLKIRGRLRSGEFIIPGDISSQFVTGLMLALGIMGGGSITTVGELKSAPYVDITADVQRTFGVIAERTENGYRIKSNGYISPESISAEGDYSNGAFYLTAGVLGSDDGIRIEGLNESSVQGDRKIVDILTAMGADIKRDNGSIIAKKARLKGIEIDCGDIPDIVPPLAVAASCAEGKTTLRNIRRLREKESDRVESTTQMILGLGGKITYDENNIYVEGTPLVGGTVDSANDHRIAMSAAIASLVTEKDVTITTAEAVNKSYPNFYDDFKMLGGIIK